MSKPATETLDAPTNWSQWVRQIHRWLSIAFTAAVLVNIAAMSQQEPALWVGLLALLPLVLLLATGLYLFALPYAARWRAGSPKRARAAS